MTVFSDLSSNKKDLMINVHGRFDYSQHIEFRESYEEIQPKPQNCTVDLENATYLDSSALGILLVLREKLATKNKIKIIHSKPDVKRVLQIANFDKLFEVD